MQTKSNIQEENGPMLKRNVSFFNLNNAPFLPEFFNFVRFIALRILFLFFNILNDCTTLCADQIETSTIE